MNVGCACTTQKDVFVTASSTVEVWDHNRSEPINSFSWGADGVLSVRFNPVRICFKLCQIHNKVLVYA
jgi:hypothetical protein